jgi:subtilisin-like proprotein convertase family protein/subtilisin family serine protease
LRYYFGLMRLLFALIVCAVPLLAAAEPRRFVFRDPQLREYVADAAKSRRDWIQAKDKAGDAVEFGSRVILQVQDGAPLSSLLRNSPLTKPEPVAPGIFLLDAPDAWTAMSEAHRLAELPGVLTSSCISRRPAELHGRYAPRPNDPYFNALWFLENRGNDGSSTGPDINVRAAWPFTKGQGVTIAIADVGVELSHPELQLRTAGSPHFNFNTLAETNATPFGSTLVWAHGTEVAGLAAAEADNQRGMSGVAPRSGLASWVIVATNLAFVSDDRLMQMYQYASNSVAVQNHSWGHPGLRQNAATVLEHVGISNAVTFSRGGKGAVMVRSAGNDRGGLGNANDDQYANDPRVIAVAAVRTDGRAASYSEPGACVLVAAPSGDTGFPLLFTTDLVGTRGANVINFPNNLNDYVFNDLGFSGTSASAPIVSGLAALLVSANTNLSYRDVQQILIHSARHFDTMDPDLTTNGARFIVSHNAGFGVPDAGTAIRLAMNWSNRPPATNVTFTSTNPAAIPDDALRLLTSGDGVPTALASIPSAISAGPQPDDPTAIVPLVYVGLATSVPATNLVGKAALIQRGVNDFSDKIGKAAQAGASFAVIFNDPTGNANCPGGDNLCPMAGTDYAAIPAVFIGQTSGEALRDLIQQGTNVLAQLRLNSTNVQFTVTNTLICEHVGVRLQTDHPLRGDVRLTLVSPQGTRSVLQRFNDDTTAGPVDWTYYSVHHFYESSAGTWRVEISDESAEAAGNVALVQLTISGVPILDTDADGLDDNWEVMHFGSLASGPKDDPDNDNYSNAREQILKSDPKAAPPIVADLSPWNAALARVSWPSSRSWNYEVLATTNLNNTFTVVTNVAGRFPETEWFPSLTNAQQRFYFIRQVPRP